MRNRVLTSPTDCDFLPPSARQRYHELALARLVSDCSDHPLVKPRFGGTHPANNPGPVETLAAIMPGDSEDHSQAIRREGLYAQHAGYDPNARIVFSTSGSSGSLRLLVTSYQEIINNAQIHGKGYAACGIAPDHVVASFGEVGRFASEFAVIAALDMTGCTIVPIVDRMDVATNVAMFNDLKVDVILAMQSELLAYLDHWEAHPESAPALRLVVTGGEPMSPVIRKRLSRLFGPNFSVRGTFQTADAGTIGFQCSACDDTEYHVHEELQHVEILDADGAPTMGPGQLVVTNLYRREMPVVRMKTGDLAQWSDQEHPCPCGRKARRLRLLGREARMLKIGGEKVASSALESLSRCMAPCGELVQFVVSQTEGGGDALTAYARSFSDPKRRAAALKVLRHDALLGKLHRTGRLEALDVQGHLPEHLTHAMHKPRALVDARGDGAAQQKGIPA